MVDAEDSKSSGPCARVGSIPTSGTNMTRGSPLSAGPFSFFVFFCLDKKDHFVYEALKLRLIEIVADLESKDHLLLL